MAERCAPHGLAVGPDGRCVLCRREAGMGSAPTVAPEPAPARTLRVPASALVFVGLALVIGVGYAFLREPDPAQRSAQATTPSPEPPATTAQSRVRAERSIPEPRELPEREQPGSMQIVVEQEVAVPPSARAAPAKKDGLDSEELRAALRNVRITVYTTQWCPHCTRARNWLRANNIPYTEQDVEASESARRDRDRINPRGGVPTVDIDGQVLTGFGEASWSQAIARATQRKLEQRRR